MNRKQKNLAVKTINSMISEDPKNVIEMITEKFFHAIEEDRIKSLADIQFVFKDIIGEMIEVTAEGLDADNLLEGQSEDLFLNVWAEVSESYTPDEARSYPSFEDFFDQIEVDNAYEEEWNDHKKNGIKEVYRRAYDQLIGPADEVGGPVA